MNIKLICLVWTLGLTTMGCGAADGDPVDPIDEQVISADGKADAFGYREGTNEATGILVVANTVSLNDLKGKVRISTQAAKAIVAARPLSTLSALDAVPYVGKTTFAKLLAYAEANGDVPTFVAGSFYSVTSVQSGQAMDGQAATTDGTAVLQWSFWGGGNQLWQFDAQSDGNYVITSRNSGKCLDVNQAGTQNGALVQEWTCNGGLNQRWTLKAAADGSFDLISVNSSRCLDLPNGTATPGTQLQQWDCAESANQHWKIAPISTCAQFSCAGEGKACGSIPDGCGGTLDCGTCATESDDPFDPSYCLGAPITRAEAAAHFPSGAVNVELVNGYENLRLRQCNSVTGCGAWNTTTPARAAATLSVSGMSIELLVQPQDEGQGYQIYSKTDVSQSPLFLYYGSVSPTDYYEGLLTNHCYRFIVHNTDAQPTSQSILYGRF